MRKVGTSVIRNISLIWYVMISSVDKGVRIIKVALYIFAMYVRTFCNLIGIWKVLNRDMLDVHSRFPRPSLSF